MSRALAIAGTGVTAVGLYPLRNGVTAACVVAAVLPYLAALGISRGVEDEARASVEYGADLYVTGEQFGRPAPLPVSTAAVIARIDGVTAVTPRIVGRIEIGKERITAVVVGVPLGQFPRGLECVEGRLPAGEKRNELVVGSELASRLHLGVGSLIPPFYRNRDGERLSEVVGVFRSDVSLWQARLVVTSLDTAAHIFDQPGLATDLLVSCRPGFQDAVRVAIARGIRATPDGEPLRLRATTRDDLAALLPQGLLHREGLFTALSVLTFVLAILVIAVTSGLGLRDRRREIGILKATGWQTDELLLRALVESLVITLGATAVAMLLAVVWLRGFNGYWIADVFLPHTEHDPGFRVPVRLTPLPALLAFLVSSVVVASGTLYATWRAACVPPAEALR